MDDKDPEVEVLAHTWSRNRVLTPLSDDFVQSSRPLAPL